MCKFEKISNSWKMRGICSVSWQIENRIMHISHDNQLFACVYVLNMHLWHCCIFVDTESSIFLLFFGVTSLYT